MEKPSDRVQDAPTSNEKTWFIYSVTSAALTLSFTVMAAIHVFSADETAAATRVHILAPFGTALLALVTFTTVVWRGLVTTRQADEQRRQNDAKDMENLAKLLIDGTQLVMADESRPASIRSGVAALQVVACSSENRFANGAMDVLVDVVKDSMVPTEKTQIFDTARRAIETAYLSGRKVEYVTTFEAPDTQNTRWKNVRALPCHFQGGVVGPEFFGDQILLDENETQYKSFQGVEFRNVHVKSIWLLGAKDCIFHECSFAVLTDMILFDNIFVRCNFSGSAISEYFSIKGGGRIVADHVEKILLDGQNFYYEDNPPSPHSEIDWTSCLAIRDKRRRFKYAHSKKPEFKPDVLPIRREG